MSLHNVVRAWSCAVCLAFLLSLAPAFAVEPAALVEKNVIVSSTPMVIEAVDNGAHGKLFCRASRAEGVSRAEGLSQWGLAASC